MIYTVVISLFVNVEISLHIVIQKWQHCLGYSSETCNAVWTCNQHVGTNNFDQIICTKVMSLLSTIAFPSIDSAGHRKCSYIIQISFWTSYIVKTFIQHKLKGCLFSSNDSFTAYVLQPFYTISNESDINFEAVPLQLRMKMTYICQSPIDKPFPVFVNVDTRLAEPI